MCIFMDSEATFLPTPVNPADTFTSPALAQDPLQVSWECLGAQVQAQKTWTHTAQGRLLAGGSPSVKAVPRWPRWVGHPVLHLNLCLSRLSQLEVGS